MNNKLIHIGNGNILVKEYQGKRVVTLKDIDTVHGRPEGTAKRNFNKNKNRFIKDQDFFVVSANEIRTSRLFPISENDFMDKTLITESGYLMLVKSFTDDLAWEVQRQLVDGYFRSKEYSIDRSKLSPKMQMFYALADSQAEIELEQKRQAEKIEELEKNQKAISSTFIKETGKDFRTWVNSCVTAIAESPKYSFVGTNEEKYQAIRRESYLRLKNKKGCNLNDRVERAKGRALREKPSITKKELSTINKISIIEADKALKPIYETVIKEMMLAYCVDMKGGAVR